MFSWLVVESLEMEDLLGCKHESVAYADLCELLNGRPQGGPQTWPFEGNGHNPPS